jgi:hypothetical protein
MLSNNLEEGQPIVQCSSNQNASSQQHGTPKECTLLKLSNTINITLLRSDRFRSGLLPHVPTVVI